MTPAETREGRDVPDFSDVRRAAQRIEGLVKTTPVMSSEGIDTRAGCRLLFKCENLQSTGAFKFRGALNAVMSLTQEELSAGVATHSSGNHAAALAKAARLRGTRATVVMPRDSSQAKKQAVLEYGASLIECEPDQQARENSLAEVIATRGCSPVAPFDDVHVIAGQGTCALEFLAQARDLDALIAPVGGGGLLAGTVLSTRSVSPRTEIYGAEPAAADDAWRSLRQGRRIALDAPPSTVADGLKTSVGLITFPIIRAGVTDILRASESGIIDAMRLIWQRMKLVVEPSGAVPLACVLENRDVFLGKRVGVIVSGGNLDLDRLPWRCLNEQCRRNGP